VINLLNKFDELLIIVENDKPDLILFVEIIPKAYESVIGTSVLNIHFIHFSNFNSGSYNPTPNNTHTLRGVAIYAADHLCSSQVFFMQIFMNGYGSKSI